MKKLLVISSVMLLSLTAASASLIPCNIGSTNSVSLGGNASPSFSCGTLTFDNFVLASATGTAPVGRVNLTGAEYNSSTGVVYMQLDPNMGSAQSDSLLFQVWGGVQQLDLSVGGSGAQVTERACGSPIPTSGANAFLCPSGSMLGQISAYSNDPNAPVFSGNFGSTSPIYIFKDITTGASGALKRSAGGNGYCPSCSNT